MRSLLAILLLLTLALPCEARRRYVPSTNVGAWDMPEEINPDLQHIAQQRADAMAAACSLDHDIHLHTNAPNWFWKGVSGEGIGMGTGEPKRIATCVVSNVVIADAWARGPNGFTYRVRLFR